MVKLRTVGGVDFAQRGPRRKWSQIKTGHSTEYLSSLKMLWSLSIVYDVFVRNVSEEVSTSIFRWLDVKLKDLILFSIKINLYFVYIYFNGFLKMSTLVLCVERVGVIVSGK